MKQAALCGAIMTGVLLAVGVGPGTWSGGFVDAAETRTLARHLTAETLSGAVAERSTLLARSTSVAFTSGTGGTVATYAVRLADHPSWVVFELREMNRLRAGVSAERIRQELISYPIAGLPASRSCSILKEWKDAQGVTRIDTDCIGKTGYGYDTEKVATLLKLALESGTAQTAFAVDEIAPTLIGREGSGRIVTTTLSLLSEGHSDFKGSGNGRKANVRKAINERVHNVIVPQGAEFSFNSLLGNVSVSNGWSLALTIFNGNELRMFPGGGICQASTTVYRALLRAGLPILKHKSHSLYVTYYEKYGVGLDATIFPGKQDLVFRNDTVGPLVFQAYTQNDEVFVRIYGVDDLRTVRITGPYFGSTAPKELLVNGRNVRNNEIAWQRSITLQDGRETQEVFSARYNAVPRSLAKKYAATTTQVRGLLVESHQVVAENR